MSRPALVFDVNETLLDIDALDPFFARLFGDEAVLRTWFDALVGYSQAVTLAGQYRPFGEVGAAVLRMVAADQGVEVDEDDLGELSERVATLPPHPEVPGALAALRDAGFRLFAFTNNAQGVVDRQLAEAGLDTLFERALSVDAGARRFKPAPKSYAAAAGAIGLAPAGLAMVACHGWDTLGAAACGWRSVLVTRPGNAAFPLGPQPDIVGADLELVAQAIIRRWR